WLVFSLFSLVVSYGQSVSEWKYINNLTPHFIINLLWAVTIFYLFYFYFIRYFEKRQFIRYLLFSVLLSVALTLLLLPVHRFFFPQFEMYNLRYMLPPIAGTFIIAQCGSLIRGFENWFAGIRLKDELETRNLKNELELLKSQINPHFLFNALNNIDSLIRTEPEKASDTLITLSDMLRYMIYETRADKVILDKELIYIKNYIRLQQLRFREKNYIRAALPDHCSGIQIAPMLLIPFIENAFKFAYNSGKLPVVDISLQCSNNRLLFTCQNQCRKGRQSDEESCGIGLENVKRRLTLLYPGQHELFIFDDESSFSVDLKIRLS
ncbi:MAG: histidine kinase, partial [Bacteroidales bacterium]|nr:histidine kinase [Bacteroidales bacterium]